MFPKGALAWGALQTIEMGGSMAQDWVLERLYHTVVNARELDKSVAFYQLLGFEILNDRRNVVWPDFVATIFGMSRAKGRGVLMVLPNDSAGPMIDIIEWVEPRAKFAAVPVADAVEQPGANLRRDTGSDTVFPENCGLKVRALDHHLADAGGWRLPCSPLQRGHPAGGRPHLCRRRPSADSLYQ